MNWIKYEPKTRIITPRYEVIFKRNGTRGTPLSMHMHGSLIQPLEQVNQR